MNLIVTGLQCSPNSLDSDSFSLTDVMTTAINNASLHHHPYVSRPAVVVAAHPESFPPLTALSPLSADQARPPPAPSPASAGPVRALNPPPGGRWGGPNGGTADGWSATDVARGSFCVAATPRGTGWWDGWTPATGRPDLAILGSGRANGRVGKKSKGGRLTPRHPARPCHFHREIARIPRATTQPPLGNPPSRRGHNCESPREHFLVLPSLPERTD
jgi:hypothetical protein